MILWFWDGYAAYSACILVVSSGSIIAELCDTVTNTNQIRKMARYSLPVNTLVNSQIKETDSGNLVPGDVIEVPSSQTIMPCDAIVLTGSVIINEAMLTGESIPVIKSSLPLIGNNTIYSPEEHSKYTIYSGT